MLSLATKQANKSNVRNQHGAVITRGGSVLSMGYNRYKPHPTWGSGPLLTMHAEAAAIRAAVSSGINLHGATIHVARSNGGLSKPCTACQELIDKHGIKKVKFTDGSQEPLPLYVHFGSVA